MDPDGDARHQQRRRRPEEEGPAVSLRPLGLADVDDFMAWASDERVMRHLKRPLCATREQAVAQIRDTGPRHRLRRHQDGNSVVGRVFEELPGLGRLEAVTDVGNARSQRALEKAGFQREGVLRSYIVRPGAGDGEARDAAVYSFLSSDPRPPLA
ncbi:unnamed protein product [Triticum turgidum subsp. durum]|uniref:N-acetyltransferase domain-containing protein n=1 Tax=Triticum turgidum subsp. durum TaxID=4567 RepID=A0A9R0W3G0_TRITD|nr:unnamed protein product [Triticum turgidum subsp. durum]